MSEASRAFIEDVSTGLPRGVRGAPDTSPADAVAAHNRALNEQHAANRAIHALKVRAAELEHAIRERKLTLGVANSFHELPRSERKAARLAGSISGSGGSRRRSSRSSRGMTTRLSSTPSRATRCQVAPVAGPGPTPWESRESHPHWP